ncbi:MAG: glycosyltransferase family 4 protein [Elainellaceae cyanobacterium]
MKVLILNTQDVTGGAARAAFRLHNGLVDNGIGSQVLVQNKVGNDKRVIPPQNRAEKLLANFGHALDSLPTLLYDRKRKPEFSSQWSPDFVTSKIEDYGPDVVNLHWINDSFVRIETLSKIKRPIVWTLHDMWAFTGGCHYDQDCGRYVNSCGKCPQLDSNAELDLSRWIWKRKYKSWQGTPLTIVTLSSWMASCVKESSLFKDYRVETIPNGIDTTLYKPVEKNVAKSLIGLPTDKRLILFGAVNPTSSPRKGFYLLKSALEKIKERDAFGNFELVVLGTSEPDSSSEQEIKTHYLGVLKDDISISLAYSAADVFVAPSTQDNLPNTVMESLACGTPCVGFNIGGIPDMVDHLKNGYLAVPFDVDDLAKGIQWVLADKERHAKLCENSYLKVNREFTQEIQASRYISLFEELIEAG